MSKIHCLSNKFSKSPSVGVSPRAPSAP